MKPMTHVLAVLVVVLFLTADSKGEEPKADTDKLQGTWSITSAVCNKGEEKDMKQTIGRTMTYADEKVIQGKKGDRDYLEGIFKLDETKNPKQINIVMKEGTIEAIYSLEGDELKLSWCEPQVKKRPAELALPKDGDKQFLFVLKRIKDDGK